MSETPDLEALARRYLDLWEAQLSALAGDPALAEQMSRLVAALGSAGLAAAAAWSATQGREHPVGSATTSSGSAGGGATGAASVRAASHDSDSGVGELSRRLAALEQRIAALEQPARRKPRARTRGPARKSR